MKRQLSQCRVFQLAVVALLWICHQSMSAQQPYTSEGQVFVVIDETRQFGELNINPSNNAIRFIELNPDIGANLWVLAFRSTDGFLYGFDYTTGLLYRIGNDAIAVSLGTLDNVSQSFSYRAGDISPGGRYLTMIGSDGNWDVNVVRVDLESPTYETTSTPLPATTKMVDISYHPQTGVLYGFDEDARQLVRIDVNNGAISAISQLDQENDVFGIYFDAFGSTYGFGTRTFGVAGSIFEITDTPFAEKKLAAGPVYEIQDLAAAHYTVGLRTAVTPRDAFPCNDVIYTYTVGNSSRAVQDNITLEHSLPTGIRFIDVLQNNLGGNVSVTPTSLRITNLTVPEGVRTITVKAEIGDIDGGEYPSQPSLSGLDANLGSSRLSDDPVTVKQFDPTKVIVNRIEDDSIKFEIFICVGDTAVLDGGLYGSEFKWNNGSVSQVLRATSTGQYNLTASSGCQKVHVQFDVTVASCPFTIEMNHTLIPQETYPCSEVVYRFIIENSAGDNYSGISFHDTLPPEVTFKGVIGDALGGELVPQPDPQVVYIRDMQVDLGFDTLDLLVEVGNIPPGPYGNRAKIEGFPSAIGPRRFSVDPATPDADSTILTVLGVERDTLVVNEIVCDGAVLVLDGTPYGYEFLWANGSTDSLFIVTAPGIYELVVYDGCDPTYVFFDVAQGDPIDVRFPEASYTVKLGDSITLDPIIFNGGDTLIAEWTDPLKNSIFCRECMPARAGPYFTVEYPLWVSNRVCEDSTTILVLVDKTRRIFAPNVFSPNGDGTNDYFYLQSPDYGIVKSLEIADRWHNIVYSTNDHILNEETTGWDGSWSGTFLQPGAYIWHARITFIDGVTQDFGGQVVVLR